MRKYIFLGPIAILIIWSILTYFGMIDFIFLPPPDRIFKKLYQLIITKDILPDIFWTVYRWSFGLIIGIIIGIPLGILMGNFKKIYESLEVAVDFFRSVPIITLFPIFLIFFGIGNKSKISLAAWASIIYVLINSMYGARHVKESRLMMARAMRATPFQIFKKIIFPEALPEIFVGIRMSISMSLVIVVAAEMIMGTNVGIGKRIFDAALVYKISEMYSGILIAGFLGYFSNKVFVAFENKIIHWAAK